MRNALIGLFENPVPPKCEVERKVLTRVLCKPNIDWDVPILDFKTDRHLRAMATQRPDIRTHVVWESSKSLEAKTVLQNFRDDGQEHLGCFIGKFHSPCSKVAKIGLDPGWI